MFNVPNQRVYIDAVTAITNIPLDFTTPPIGSPPTLTLTSDNNTVEVLADSIISTNGKFSAVIPSIKPGDYSVVASVGISSISVNYNSVLFSVNHVSLRITPGIPLNLNMTPFGAYSININLVNNVGSTVNHNPLAFTVGIPLTFRGLSTKQSLLGTTFKVESVPNITNVNLALLVIKNYNNQVTDMSSYQTEVFINDASTGATVPQIYNKAILGSLVIEYTDAKLNKTRTVPINSSRTSVLTVDNIVVPFTVDNTVLLFLLNIISPTNEYTNLNLATQLPTQFETISF